MKTNKKDAWISVRTKLPEDIDVPEQYIVYCGKANPPTALQGIYANGKFYMTECWQSEEAIENLDNIDITNLVTHWQFLPDAPNQ